MRVKGVLSSLNIFITNDNLDHTYIIKSGDHLPGDFDSTYHFECRVNRRLPRTMDKDDSQQIFCRDTICVDHTSSYIIIYNQVSLYASENFISKNIYELQV